MIDFFLTLMKLIGPFLSETIFGKGNNIITAFKQKEWRKIFIFLGYFAMILLTFWMLARSIALSNEIRQLHEQAKVVLNCPKIPNDSGGPDASANDAPTEAPSPTPSKTDISVNPSEPPVTKTNKSSDHHFNTILQRATHLQ